jgi:AraC-like DNA-binding protein
MTGRSHSFAHIILPLSEMLYLRIGEVEYWLNSDNIAFVPPHTFHRIICTQKLIWFNIPEDMVQQNNLTFFLQNPVFSLTDYLRPLIALIRYEILIDADSDSLRYLFYYLFSKLISGFKLKSIQYMETHYVEQINIATLAQLENYNPTYYIGWFKNKIGVTPSEYLNRLRIGKAKEMLINTQCRIIDIAIQTGYANGSSFARAFRQSEGISPQEYRKQNQISSNFNQLPYWQND